MKKTLVVPSIREECFADFQKAWHNLGDWDEVILVEDNPERTFKTSGNIFHYSWKEIQSLTNKDSWIFSKRDSAIRSFGFLMALNCQADYILTLDDDCYPRGEEPIFESHIKAMESFKKWAPSIDGIRTRGLPYKNKGKLESVVANMGLWTGYPDLDAPHSLADPDLASNGQFHPRCIPPNRLIPSGQYVPLCGMNFCFKREVAPLAYFPLMGEGQPYSRFDDIWFGIIFKKIIDHLGLSLSVGEPFVSHEKASNVFTNLKKEAPGIEANETFWEIIDKVILTKSNPKECMIEMGNSISNHDYYIQALGKAMITWANLF